VSEAGAPVPPGAATIVGLAGRSGALLRDREWRHRQVDTLEVTEALTTRTHTSIDFSIPKGAPTLGLDGSWGMEGEGELFLLPVSALGKWPPFDRFDLRDDRGKSLPLLRGEENREADAAALLGIHPGLPPALCEQLEAIVRADRPRALALQQRLAELLVPLVPRGSDDAAQKERVLLAIVKHWAAVLATNSLLWVPVRGRCGDRRLVKFEFQQPLESELRYWPRVEQSFSWAPTRVLLEVPMVTSCLTYHLQFRPPRDLRVIAAELELSAGPRSHQSASTPPTPPPFEGLGPLLRRFGRWSHRLLALASATFLALLRRRWSEVSLPEGAPAPDRAIEPEPPPGVAHARVDPRSAHLYVSRPALGRPFGGARFQLRAARAGLISGALIAAVLIALIMTLFAACASEIIRRHLAPAVTVLVLAPGLIGFLAVRPNQHPLLRRNVRSVRGLLVIAAAIPILGAVLLVVIGNATVVQACWIGLACLSWVLAALLGISWLLPPKPPRRS
jgi:hypothetical protein